MHISSLFRTVIQIYDNVNKKILKIDNIFLSKTRNMALKSGY